MNNPITLTLALDGEQLRSIMRQREKDSVHTPGQHIVIPSLVKLSIIRSIQLSGITSRQNITAPTPQKHWPDALRQMHWELCSGTQLRPIARIMNQMALLPDPFVKHGGSWCNDDTVENTTPTQDITINRLYAAARLDVVLQGQCTIIEKEKSGITTLNPGDAVLSDTFHPVLYGNTIFHAWTEFYYQHQPNSIEKPIEKIA